MGTRSEAEGFGTRLRGGNCVWWLGRIPIICAISAPSSLAVEFARESGQTLIGFLRGETMNIYSSPERVGGDTTQQ